MKTTMDWLLRTDTTNMMTKSTKWRGKLQPLYRFATRVPPILRSFLGLGLIVLGFAGVILPLLGFWLVPIGLLFIALDIGPLRRRVEVWFESSS
jgi:hypothetical protein